MTEELKEEILEEIVLGVNFGFENEATLLEGIREMFEDEPDFDENWLRQTLSVKYKQHQTDSLNWGKPTDFEKLAKTFDALAEDSIVCLHNAGYTKQDAIEECLETITRLRELNIETRGFCYYHAQDLARAVDPDVKNLYIGFDSLSQDDTEALQIANKIVTSLKNEGFTVSWPGTVEQRIEIKNINWQKVPDLEEWGAERMIQIMAKQRNHTKNL